MLVLRILVQTVQCAQKKLLFDLLSRLPACWHNLAHPHGGKIPDLDHPPSTHGAAAVQDLDAATARKGIGAWLKKNSCNSRVWWSRYCLTRDIA
jgi:hypothetical protein